jgi:hypothetical protein
MIMGSAQPPTEMGTRNILEGKEWPARKSENLTAIFEPTVWKMRDPRRLTTLWVPKA